MSDPVRRVIACQQWEITKGHIRASVSLRSAKRLTDPSRSLGDDNAGQAEWERFNAAAEAFIAAVEDEGWHE